MKRYLLIVHQPAIPGPVVGAVEVPPCFTPSEELIEAAWDAHMGLLIATEEELATKGGLEGLLLAQGQHMLDALRDIVQGADLPSDPTLN